MEQHEGFHSWVNNPVNSKLVTYSKMLPVFLTLLEIKKNLLECTYKNKALILAVASFQILVKVCIWLRITSREKMLVNTNYKVTFRCLACKSSNVIERGDHSNINIQNKHFKRDWTLVQQPDRWHFTTTSHYSQQMQPEKHKRLNIQKDQDHEH